VCVTKGRGWVGEEVVKDGAIWRLGRVCKVQCRRGELVGSRVQCEGRASVLMKRRRDLLAQQLLGPLDLGGGAAALGLGSGVAVAVAHLAHTGATPLRALAAVALLGTAVAIRAPGWVGGWMGADRYREHV
jgi:hypothetical protein